MVDIAVRINHGGIVYRWIKTADNIGIKLHTIYQHPAADTQPSHTVMSKIATLLPPTATGWTRLTNLIDLIGVHPSVVEAEAQNQPGWTNQPEWTTVTLSDGRCGFEHYRRQVPPPYSSYGLETDFEGPFVRHWRYMEATHARFIPNATLDGEISLAHVVEHQLLQNQHLRVDITKLDMTLWWRQVRKESLQRERQRRWMVEWLTQPYHNLGETRLFDMMTVWMESQLDHLERLHPNDLAPEKRGTRQTILDRFRPSFISSYDNSEVNDLPGYPTHSGSDSDTLAEEPPAYSRVQTQEPSSPFSITFVSDNSDDED